jgi:hypothetical protein
MSAPGSEPSTRPSDRVPQPPAPESPLFDLILRHRPPIDARAEDLQGQGAPMASRGQTPNASFGPCLVEPRLP